jgi:hypothetical protein
MIIKYASSRELLLAMKSRNWTKVTARKRDSKL